MYLHRVDDARQHMLDHVNRAEASLADFLAHAVAVDHSTLRLRFSVSYELCCVSEA